VAGHDRVAPGPVLVHVEVVRAVAHERVELLERAGIEQLLDPLPRGHLAALVLLLDGGVGARLGGVAQLAQPGDLLVVGLGVPLATHAAGHPTGASSLALAPERG
jgi:hypothetical protein